MAGISGQGHGEQEHGLVQCPFSTMASPEQTAHPGSLCTQASFLLPNGSYCIALSHPYLVDPTEHGHKLAEDSCTDAGDVDKRALEDSRRARYRVRGLEGHLHSFITLVFPALGTELGARNIKSDRNSALRSFIPERKGD